ncbi:MAG TPA: hypothetical protein PKC18_11715 [Lacipirellulaceae bacterium]|nr:hypothetical protein [Lacipirellulaceae bacterium]
MRRSTRHVRAGLFAALAVSWAAALPAAEPRPLDARRLTAAGLRVLEGRHVRIVTDLPPSPGVDELPAAFDAAVPQWEAHFGLRLTPRDARWLGFVIDDRAAFAALGLLPAERPQFISGYANGWEFWLVDQPSDYYRRHLMLHEGTHAFMQTQLGGAGAPWYMEGMAELLGTHQWRDGQIELGVIPADRDAAPMWGRIKLVRDSAAAGRPWPLERVLAVDNSRAMDVEEYAWTWALATLLDGHPQFRARFRALQGAVTDPAFTQRFRAALADDWGDLAAEWTSLAATLDYGYNVAAMAMVHADSAPVESASRRSTIRADRGWQSAGWILRAGGTYRISASGRYTLVRDGEEWPCEPGGVTIDYHEGRPVGALLGALRPIGAAAEADASFARPMLVGLRETISPQRDAVLYLRVNDSAANVGKNVGKIDVRVSAAPR